MIRLPIILPALLAGGFAAKAADFETRPVAVGEGRPTSQSVYYATPTGNDAGTKKLVITGVVTTLVNPSMESSVSAGVYDGIQWTAAGKAKLVHKYEIVMAVAKTPLTMIVSGVVIGEPPSSPGKGSGPTKRKIPFDITAPPEATVASATRLAAPDNFTLSPPNAPGQPSGAGTPNTRLIVGAGEEVDFRIVHTHLGQPDVSVDPVAGRLKTDSSSGLRLTTCEAFTYIAGDNAGPHEITLHFHEQGKVRLNNLTGRFGAQDMKIRIQVVAPSGEKVDKLGPLPSAAPGEAGVMMSLIYTANPRAVNFANVEVKEISDGAAGDPLGATGYFQSLSAVATSVGVTDILRHAANPAWIAYDATNQWTDTAGWSGIGTATGLSASQKNALYAVPFAVGQFHWNIPVRWRVNSYGTSHAMYTRAQTFEMQNAQGGMKTGKNDAVGNYVYETRNP